MTENEAIEVLSNELIVITDMIGYCKDFEKESDLALAYRVKRKDALNMAISALKEIQLYKDGKLCLVPEDVYLKQCCELDTYKEIGTVEECGKAVEKQKPKKCNIDSCPDHTHYKCPSCGKIHLSRYKHGFPSLGRIPRFCDHCGQAIDENLEETEDAISND